MTFKNRLAGTTPSRIGGQKNPGDEKIALNEARIAVDIAVLMGLKFTSDTANKAIRGARNFLSWAYQKKHLPLNGWHHYQQLLKEFFSENEIKVTF